MPRLFLFAFLSLAGSAHAGSMDEVVAKAAAMQEKAGMRTASIGFCIVPMEGEPDEAAGYHADIGLVPASVMKVVTTAAAIEILGKDFRFKTELQLAGVLGEDGTLTGDVVVRGGGDPTLAETDRDGTFAKWKAALAEAGVKKVEGSVIGDASLFGTQLVPDTWQHNDIGNYYGAGACGLTFYQNMFYCSFKTPSVGAIAPFVGTDPDLPELEFFNEMRVGAAGSGDQGYIYGVPYAKNYYLRGTVPAGKGSFTIKGSLPDPAYFCARAFTEYLNDSGLPVSGDPTTDRLAGLADRSIAARKVIHEQTSDTLGSIMSVTNHKSNNLQAECMHRMIGVKASEKGTTAAASEAVEKHFADKGIDMTGFYMGDGCGLSRANTVTPRQLALMLYHAAKAEDFETFYSSLPGAGQSGTLRGIGGGSAAEGRIRAKSGTIDRVKNYAGYCNARSGKRYAFAIFVTNYSGTSSEVKSAIVDLWTEMVGL